MVLDRKEYNSYNKNIYQYIIKDIIPIKKCLKISILTKLINKDNTPYQCTSSTLLGNNKILSKISINPIVLSLLFYCYLSIVKPQWLLDSYLKNYFLWMVSFLISFSCILKISNQVILNLSSLQKCCSLSKQIIGFIDLLLNKLTTPISKSTYNIEISKINISLLVV